jgi:hypothetical protein
MTHTLAGLPIHVSSLLSPPEHCALDDFEERLAAMTAHHLDLSLVSLTEIVDGTIYFIEHGVGGPFISCHPDTLPFLQERLAALSLTT